MPTSTSHVAVHNETVTLDDGHKLALTIVGASTSASGGHQLPILLFVVGSSGLGRLYHRLALELAAQQHFQCVYYDKRGFCSAETPPPTGPASTAATATATAFIPVSQHADDAAAVIKHVSSPTAAARPRPVYAFGTSTGATAVLELLVRHHPDGKLLVHTAILHEPIVLSLAPIEQGRDEIVAEYRRIAAIADPLDALDEFARAYIFTPPTPRGPSRSTAAAAAAPQSQQQPEQGTPAVETTAEPDPNTPAPAPPPRRRRHRRRDPVVIHNARETQREGLAMLAYRIDVARAREHADKIVLLGGTESRELPVSVPGRALAADLGEGDDEKRVWDVPGGHADFASRKHGEAFAARVLDVLRREGRVLVGGSPGVGRERAAKI